MVQPPPDITLIFYCGNHGRKLHPSVRSIEAAISRAESETNVSIEWLVATGNVSPETDEYLQNSLPYRAQRLYEAGLAEAIGAAAGEYIGLLSGQDLVSSNWLSKTYLQALDGMDNLVLHPAMVVSFGDEVVVTLPPDQEDPDFSIETLFTRNPWPQVSFARNEIFQRYLRSRRDDDKPVDAYWLWVCETVADGIVHKPVPGTFSCCRTSNSHRCVSNRQDQALLLPPSRLFHLAEGSGGRQ